MSDGRRNFSIRELLEPRAASRGRRARRRGLSRPMIVAVAFLAGLRFRQACREGACRHPRHARRYARDLQRRAAARR